MNQNKVTEKLFALLNSPRGRKPSTITITGGGTIVGIPHGFHMFSNSCLMDVFKPSNGGVANHSA